MSFYTALTGLNAAQSTLEITSNNIANVNTAGFKRSRADFGDIFATSPLQKSSSVIGQGVALKEVSQEFSQGNIQSSSNALDLAISGDGFFMLKSADGLQNIYTRNGSFTLNDQYNVVNSAGQALQAAAVDSSGKADLGNIDRLTIPKKTTGDAKQTSLVQLGLNFPADASVITAPFNRSNPASYNKTTALTVYDQGGNSYLATVYYAKTQNASQADPTNKWQTYVFIGDTQVNAALTQATDANGEKLYVNKYGQLAPENQVADQLVNRKTQMFELDNLNDQRTSVPASISGKAVTDYDLTTQSGLPASEVAANLTDLQNFMTVDVDGSGEPVTLDISSEMQAIVASGQAKISGAEIAQVLQNKLRQNFGDDAYWNFSTAASQKFSLEISDPNSPSSSTVLNVNLSQGTPVPGDKMTLEDVLGTMQSAVDAANAANWTAAGNTGNPPAVTVSYDDVSQGFRFTYADNTKVLAISGGANNTAGTNGDANDLLGLGRGFVNLNADGSYPTASGATVIGNGGPLRSPKVERYGMTVTFDNVNQTFNFASGTTGDTSTIAVSNLSGFAQKLLGLTSDTTVGKSSNAVRGVQSLPAVVSGSSVNVNVANNFSVDSTNNRFVVTVDDVKATITLPSNPQQTLDGFVGELEKRINSLVNANGNSVSGVTVKYDYAKNCFTFISGTTGSDSFIQVSGSSVWGLANVNSGRGSTSTWVKPTQYTELVDGLPVAQYIDARGQQTSSADGFTNLPEWSPIYLHKGELTFDTAGSLVSPKSGAQLDPVFLPDGKGELTINIDYSKSTQFSSPFAVLSQSQDGAPEGDLIGVNIGDNGLVNASYSNSKQKSLGKIVLANFSNPNGLRQIGDSSFYSSSSSGTANFGEAGAAGFGTVRAGATERANVDLTQELVDLITGQRNFQASAKAIETDTQLTQTIIQIRN